MVPAELLEETETGRMKHYFDASETRSAKRREKALFHTLRHLLPKAVRHASGLRQQLKAVEIDRLTDRAALQAIPVLRKDDLVALQSAHPPFGRLTTGKPGAMRRLLVSPGPIFEPQGHGSDWWGAARALYAAGIRKGDIVHNAFSYHLTPGGHIMESGAHALKCAVIPAGTGNTEQQVETIAAFQPTAYAGTPDFLKILLDTAETAKRPAKSIVRALVSGAAFPPSLQDEIRTRGIDAYQAYATADLGIVAYESSARSGLICNEDLIVEIVRPGTGEPASAGDVGEVVVTRLNGDYPLLRFGTGDLSRFLDGPSACGRSNLRLAGWLGRADQAAKVKGMFVRPGQVAEIGRRHPELGRMRLVVSRVGEQDRMILKAESAVNDEGLATSVAATLQAVTKLKGIVELAEPNSLPNDGKVIHDERM